MPALIAGNAVIAQAQPKITGYPTTDLVSYTVGGGAPAQQIFSFTTSGASVTVSPTAVSYSPSTASGWLLLSPAVGNAGVTVPGAITAYVLPGSLSAGSYSATISLGYSAAVDPTSTMSLTVFLTVSPTGGGVTPGEVISVSISSLAFSYSPGAATPAAQSFTASVNDGASFNVSAVTNDGNHWLSVSPSTSTSPGTINVSVNPASLAPGSYTGTITLSTASNSAQVSVALTVSGVGLTVTPTTLTFNIPQNYGFGASQTLQITSTVPQAITATAASDNNWLLVDTTTATTPASLNVRANDSSLPQGTYSGTVTIQTSPTNSFQVPVTLNVGPPAVLSIQPATLVFTGVVGGVSPGAQSVNVKSLNSSALSFSVTTSTTDGANWLSAAAIVPTPGQVMVSVNPTGLVPGSYTGIVTVTPSVANASPQPILVNLTVSPAPNPVITSVVSSASFLASAVAPGEFVTIFGSSIGPPSLSTPTPGTTPTTLGGVTVTFDGIAAPILYASATQTGVQVPYGIGSPQTVLSVQRAGASSVNTPLNSIPAAPGLFTASSNGLGQAAALNQNFSLNGPASPISRGSIIVLYGTGEGKTNPTSVEGTTTITLPPFPQPLFPVTVSFGGVMAAAPLYAGETPGAIAGLMQINVVVPAGAPVGPAVPVVVFINGQASQNTATVAIQ